MGTCSRIWFPIFGIIGKYDMNLKKHEAICVVDVWDGGLRTDEVQQLHVMVRCVLDENYTKSDPFLCMPQFCDKDIR